MARVNLEHANRARVGNQRGPFGSVGLSGEQVVDGVNLAYWRKGTSQQTIVLVHGNSACKEAFVEQFQSDVLNEYGLLAIDLPGHGASDDAADGDAHYTISGYARLLGKLLDALGVASPILVGWSLGGHIVLEMVAQGFVVSGVLITGTPPVGPGEECLSRGFLPFTFDSATSSENPSAEEIQEYVGHLYGSLEVIPDQFMAAANRADGKARAIMGADWIGGNTGTSQADLVANFPAPIAVVHGQDDVFVDAAYLDEIAWGNLWQGKIARINECGHAPFVERSNIFNTYLLGFAAHCF